jgi:hypothetical protein
MPFAAKRKWNFFEGDGRKTRKNLKGNDADLREASQVGRRLRKNPQFCAVF